jgi:hypothetical protein
MWVTALLYPSTHLAGIQRGKDEDPELGSKYIYCGTLGQVLLTDELAAAIYGNSEKAKLVQKEK